MTKMDTLTRIKAYQEEKEAKELAENTKELEQYTACATAFAPLMKMWDEVKDIEVPHWRHRRQVLLAEHLRTIKPRVVLRFHPLKQRDETARVRHDPPLNPEFGCAYGANGPYFYTRDRTLESRDQMIHTQEEIEQMFIEFLSDRIGKL